MIAWARLQRKEGGRAHVFQGLRVKVVELDKLRRGAVRPDDDVVLAFRGRLQELKHRVLELTRGLRRPESKLLAIDVDVGEVKTPGCKRWRRHRASGALRPHAPHTRWGVCGAEH